jgi:hypothetical protein
MEGLPEHGPESAPAGVVAVPAVLVVGGLGEELGGNPGSKTLFQLAEGKSGDGAQDPAGVRAHGVKACAPTGEERCVSHRAVYIPLY